MNKWDEHDQAILSCRRCPRLVEWREHVARVKRKAFIHEEYWGKPVPGFGDHNAKLLVVGLAPGAHGSNRTGRMFTGDSSGDFLYRALHETGFASQPYARNLEDGLELKNLFITAVCRCAPPDNKPTSEEINNCQPFMQQEIQMLSPFQGVVALGKIAFDKVVKLILPPGQKRSTFKFCHNGFFDLGDGLPWVLSSYHPSRQNTQTGRLTMEMFLEIWTRANSELEKSSR